MPADQTLLTSVFESPDLLHELGDIVEAGILTLDADLVIRGYNRWLESASGLSGADVVGRPILDVFPELRGGHAEAAFRRALDGMTTVFAQRFHRYLLPLPAPAGHERYERMQQSARVVPIVRDDRVCGALAVVRDVTERVAREDELREAMERTEVASRAKSEFLAAISHELRTPLSAVIGYMDLLQGEMVGPVSALQKNYLGRVRAAARHLLEIIEEILTFSRVEAGKEEVHLEPVDVAELARSADVLFEPEALRKGIGLRVVLPDGPLEMCTDATKLRQILLNLLGNAVKFTDAGEVVLELDCEAEVARFQVRDTGPGIAPADCERIFEPFTQLDGSWKRAKGGTGLGLPLSRRLAGLLGGTLTMESAVGRGTCFTLLVPVSPAPAAESLDGQQGRP